jgi:hypothetical protein
VVFIFPGIKIPFEENGVRAGHAITVTPGMGFPQSSTAKNMVGAAAFSRNECAISRFVRQRRILHRSSAAQAAYWDRFASIITPS